MKEGWEYRKLGEVFASINNGANIKQIKGASGIPITRIETLSNDMFNRDRMGYANVGDITPYESYVLNEGDILMSHINSMKFLGRAVAYVKKDDETIIHGMNLLRLVPTSEVFSPFMVYQFQTSFFRNQIQHISHQSVNQASFNITNLKGLNVLVPPLSEQQSIVDYLDSAFAKIDAMKANAEKALNEGKALFQASLKEMLEPKEGWEEKTLKEVAKYRRGSFPQPYGNKEWYDGAGAMPFVQVAELQEDSFDMIPVTKRRISKIAQPLSVFVPAGTVLVSLQGSIGKVAITNYDSYVDRTIAIFQDYKINIDKTFFAYQLKIRFEIERIKARGTTIKTITKEEFANFIINCPSLSEQQSIVDTLDSLKSKVDKLQENFDKISQECDALKQAILRQVFE